MLQRFFKPNHPLRLLLYLEWVLLGIALVTAFSPLPPPRRFRPWGSPLEIGLGVHSPLGVVLTIVALGLVGFQLPVRQPRLEQALYTVLGFGLSWLAVSFGGRNGNFFPALLLIVVIRACVLFPWSGRLLVTLLAYGLFLIRLLTVFFRRMQFLESGMLFGPGLPSGLRRFPPEQIQGLVINLTLNSALLFGLVLLFVLLMVGALLTERQSRKALVQVNDRLRRYTLLVENQATLQERNRIAREMHDSVGHALTAQSIQLENVALWLPQNLAKASEHLQTARQLGKEALQSVRQSVASLRTDPLKGATLVNAVTQLVENFEQRTSIEVKAHLALGSTPPKEMSTALYRTLQEALTNVSKHSQAHTVHLKLTHQAATLYLCVEDNGQGFNPTENTTGFGLQSMRERVEVLGGTFHLSSQVGQGCSIQIQIPVTSGIL